MKLEFDRYIAIYIGIVSIACNIATVTNFIHVYRPVYGGGGGGGAGREGRQGI